VDDNIFFLCLPPLWVGRKNIFRQAVHFLGLRRVRWACLHSPTPTVRPNCCFFFFFFFFYKERDSFVCISNSSLDAIFGGLFPHCLPHHHHHPGANLAPLLAGLILCCWNIFVSITPQKIAECVCFKRRRRRIKTLFATWQIIKSKSETKTKFQFFFLFFFFFFIIHMWKKIEKKTTHFFFYCWLWFQSYFFQMEKCCKKKKISLPSCLSVSFHA